MDDGLKRAAKEYGGLLAYLIPCTIIVGFSNIILVPRFEMIAERSGIEIPSAVALMISAYRYFMYYYWIVVPVFVLVVALAEAFSKFWRQRRNVFFSVVKWLVVFATMIALLLIATATLALIPTSTQP